MANTKPPKNGEKIIQILTWDGHMLGLSSEGRIYKAVISGDMRFARNHYWLAFIEPLAESYKDEK